jgi:hypothetical protein
MLFIALDIFTMAEEVKNGTEFLPGFPTVDQFTQVRVTSAAITCSAGRWVFAAVISSINCFCTLMPPALLSCVNIFSVKKKGLPISRIFLSILEFFSMKQSC